jgi:hypothetical protein
METNAQWQSAMNDLDGRCRAFRKLVAEFESLHGEIKQVMSASGPAAARRRERLERVLTGEYARQQDDALAGVAALQQLLRELDGNIGQLSTPPSRTAAVRRSRRGYV